MRIAFDINDVFRAYTEQFEKYYTKDIDRSFDTDNLDIWTNDLFQIYPFETKKQYLEFVYEDRVFELFGAANTTERNLSSQIDFWFKSLDELDDEHDICLVSTNEFGKSIGATYFFLSKLAIKSREVKLFKDCDGVWDFCDILITANPDLLKLKPEGKKSIKIESPYNTDSESDFSYETISGFLNDGEILNEITK